MRATILALVLVGCTSAEPPAPQAELELEPAPPRRAESGELMLRRTGCYGECPAYTAFVDANGEVFYHGRDFAAHRGLRTGSVDPGAVQALFGLALDNGYFDAAHDYDEAVTDRPTYYTSVVVDGRRQWVRNYVRQPPPAVAAIEEGIDGLLASTRWHDAPLLAAVRGHEPCLHLGWSIDRRCRDALELRGRGGDCEHWFAVWNGLERRPENADTPQRCARQLRSFEAAAAAPLEPLPAVTLGPKCQRWFDAEPMQCRAALLGGVPGSCRSMARQLTIVLASLHDTDLDAATRGRIAEMHCGMFVD